MTPAGSLPPPDGLPLPRRHWATVAMGLGITLAVLDGAIANVALPTIARDLHADPAGSIWVVNAYQLAVIVTLLPLAALADKVGYRRVYLGGMVLFTLASLACAGAGSLNMLVAARVAQGLGGAGVMSVNGALIRFIYPRAQLGRGIGINAVVVAFGSAVGPTLASAILSVGAWQWLFAINIPVGIAAFAVGRRTLPDTSPSAHRFDFAGALLSAFTFGPLIMAIDGFSRGVNPLEIAGGVALALASGAALVLFQRKSPAPLLPLDLMRIPIFALSIATSVCSFGAQMLAFVSLPFLLQAGPGFSDVQTGLLMTPWPLAIVIVAPIAGRLADRYPAGLLGGIGLAVFATGLALLASMPEHPTPSDIVWRMALGGAGFGLFQSPNNRAIIGSAPTERSGGASGMLSTARLFGQTTGTALVALALARAPEHGTVIALYLGAAVALLASRVSMLRVLPAARAVRKESRDDALP